MFGRVVYVFNWYDFGFMVQRNNGRIVLGSVLVCAYSIRIWYDFGFVMWRNNDRIVYIWNELSN
jgi:hypothetical protein